MQEITDKRHAKSRLKITEDKRNSTFRRRHSLQVGTNWLQEYSAFNM